MTNQRSRRWIPVAATLALAAVLLITAIVILPYPGKTTKTTETATAITTTSTTSLQTSFTKLSASDYNSSLGLDLAMSIGRSTLLQNGGVSMFLSLDNTLDTRNNITRPALPGGVGSYPYLGSCNQLPLGVKIFQGNYDVGNVSQGEPYGLFGPNDPVNCPGVPNSFSLAPMSNDLTFPTGLAAANMTYWGYWAYHEGDVFRPFSPGVYTMEGQDWGGR
jgi:hypothetical protein